MAYHEILNLLRCKTKHMTTLLARHPLHSYIRSHLHHCWCWWLCIAHVIILVLVVRHGCSNCEYGGQTDYVGTK